MIRGPLQFEVLHRSGTCGARIGRVSTPHGVFDTPAFMPVGTRGSVKGLFPQHVAETGAQIVLNNTYHLMLRPGSELIQQLGGVHRFMNWAGPILTDSGGYQAYSLADTNKVDDEGVTFKSIIDGKIILLTPELAMKVQNELGPDIMMALDDCPPPVDPNIDSMDAAQRSRVMGAVSRDAKAAAVTGAGGGGRARRFDHATRLAIANERTVRWLERCKRAHARAQDQALFGIVQGGTDLARRTWCAEQVTNIELPGYAIGGVAVGEPPEAIARVVQHTAPLLPTDKPRYLMGVGYERDILTAVMAGVDMFDCVLPTRNGRNANAFTSGGQIRLKNNKYALDERPIEPGCDCHACLPQKYGWNTPDQRPFSRAYLRHLFAAGEMLGPILVSLHNLRHYQRFMMDLRGAIRTEDWAGLVTRWPVLGSSSESTEAASE